MQQYIYELQDYNNGTTASQTFSYNKLDTIKKYITTAQIKLDNLIETKMLDISDNEILKLSQELDLLICTYMIMSR